jgi:hypothetical protein
VAVKPLLGVLEVVFQFLNHRDDASVLFGVSVLDFGQLLMEFVHVFSLGNVLVEFAETAPKSAANENNGENGLPDVVSVGIDY